MPPTKREPEEEEKDSKVRKIALIGGMSAEHTLVYVDGNPTVLPRMDKFKVGQYVLVDPTNGYFEKVFEDIDSPCQELIVKEVLNSSTVRADVGGQTVILAKSKALQLEEGDHVGIDMKVPVILKKLPKPVSNEVKEIINVKWEDILGHDEAVVALKEIAEGFTHEKIAAFYGRRQSKGVMLSGPPGCGKTLLAKAVATALSSEGFFTIRGPEILSKWVGQSEEGARSFFEMGQTYFKKTGKQAVLFIDEADALLQKRGDSHRSVITDTLVPQFLTLMDGLTTNSSVVILATNRPDQLDDAVTRPGRIDKKIQIKRPTPEVGIEILTHYFSKKPTIDEPRTLAAQAVEYLQKANLAKLAGETTLNAAHYLSGALCEMLVEDAAGNAYHRNIKDKGSPKGISCDDVHLASKSTAIGLLNLNHDAVIFEHGLR